MGRTSDFGRSPARLIGLAPVAGAADQHDQQGGQLAAELKVAQALDAGGPPAASSLRFLAQARALREREIRLAGRPAALERRRSVSGERASP